MSTELQAAPSSALEKILIEGNLDELDPNQRIQYVNKLCEITGLNSFLRPFDYIRLQGKLTLYANKSANEQLRKIHGISVEIKNSSICGDLYKVVVRGTDSQGRFAEASGVVPLGKSAVENANVMMKAETKAFRRVTLSLGGLGMLDETELETIKDVSPPMYADVQKPKLSATKDTAEDKYGMSIDKLVSNYIDSINEIDNAETLRTSYKANLGEFKTLQGFTEDLQSLMVAACKERSLRMEVSSGI